MIHLRLDRSSGVPTYIQLLRHFRYAIWSGTLRPGMRLPPARELVATLAINPNTVFKAYAQLERTGLVISRPGQGTYVAVAAPAPIDGQVRRKLDRSLEAWLIAASRAGIERETVLTMVTQMLDAVYAREIA